MGRTSEGSRGKSSRFYRSPWTIRNKQRASLSFFIVVVFFVVFGTILFTEVFVIDEKNRNGGFSVRNGLFMYQTNQEKNEYVEELQGETFPKSVGSELETLLLNEQLALPNGGDNVIKSQGYSPSSSVGHQIINEPQATIPVVDGSWQNVAGTVNKFFVFSAYFDRREAFHAIRIIGATRTRSPETVYCRFWYPVLEKNSTKYISTNVTANVKVIRENWNLKYSAVFVFCPLKKGQAVPLVVSVFSKSNAYPSNMLLVINHYNETQLPTNKYAVCVKPLHYNYEKTIPMIEFIEFNRILGVEHFIFYNHTIGEQVDCLLREYISKGVVTLLPWDLDLLSQKEIRTEGLFAALNDCLYRTMYKFSHVLFIDFDEYIIPTTKCTLPELIENIQSRKKGPKIGAFSFQNAFFYLQWEDDEWTKNSLDLMSVNLITQRKTRRKSKLHPHKQRSKYICRPERIVEVGNHFVWEFVRGYVSYNAPPKEGILHHYRVCELGGDDCVKQASVIDQTAFNYRRELVNAAKLMYESNKEKCGFQDLHMTERQHTAAIPFIDIFNNDLKKLVIPKM